MHDGRNASLTLDDASFELVSCPTDLTTQDFYALQDGDESLRQTYYKQVETFVQEKLGCDKVIVFHSQVRNPSQTKHHPTVQSYSGGGPHTDSSAVAADQLALTYVLDNKNNGNDPQHHTAYGRYLYLNLWRNIAEQPIQDNHLAMLDERSTVKPDDYITKDLFGPGYAVVQYGLNARHADIHKWYYFPQMKKEEAILFKQFDSDWTKQGRTCFHMSVADPNAHPGAPARESIEARMMCFWNKANCSVDSMPTKENVNLDLIQDMEAAAKLDTSMLESVSAWQLLLALLAKLPFVGRLFQVSWGTGAPYKYTGNPKDYVARFVQAVDYFPSWPSTGVSWVRTEMKRASTVEAGIAVITKALVDDALHYQKTKHLQKNEKAEIVKALLENDRYMTVAKKHFGSVVS